MMLARTDTAVQISAAPMDVRHLQFLLPHQIRAWQANVDRIVVTIDTHHSKSGRFRTSNYQENFEKLRQLLRETQKTCTKLHVAEVDYSPSAQRDVAQYFFGRDSIPPKAWHGGYFYSLFFGLYAASARYVMHFDSDMMWGGGSDTWVREAIAVLEQNEDVLLATPFPGPPRADGQIFKHKSAKGFQHSREKLPQLAYRHMHVSSRDFMVDLDRFKSRIGKFPWLKPTTLQTLKGGILGNPAEAIDVEELLSRTLQGAGMYRIDMLGSPPSKWSLHPPYRSDEFYRRLPEIIGRVESGDVPEGQLGHFDLNDSIIDWSSARTANARHKRYMKIIRDKFPSFV